MLILEDTNADILNTLNKKMQDKIGEHIEKCRNEIKHGSSTASLRE